MHLFDFGIFIMNCVRGDFCVSVPCILLCNFCELYADPDYFTIILYHGGEMQFNPKKYVNGTVDYVDNCNGDEMSFLEIGSMLKEVNDCGGFHTYSYKLPKTDMERGCFDLESDEDVLHMCQLVANRDCKLERYVEIFVETMEPISTSQVEMNTQAADVQFVEASPRQAPLEKDINNQNYPSQDTENMYDDMFYTSTQDEIRTEEEFREAFGLEKDSSEDDDGEEGDYEYDSSESEESFHSDQSNKDEDDDDLLFDTNVDDMGGEKGFYDVDQEHGNDSDQSTVYAASDDERMAANSTDEDEINYPVFDEDADMVNPVFQLGMCFKNSRAFREAVKKHAIQQRRPIVNCRNFGRKVQYVCQHPCQWKIYASPMHKGSITYQIKTFNPVHTCMPTFNQKQINSRWLSEYYEKDIRMNPSWPIDAFHKKIVNELKCHVSKHAVYRAKARALKKINGTHKEQYSQLWRYAYQLRKVLPESTIKILTEDPEPGQESGRFLRFYICLEPLKKAFRQSCRKIVGLDGCHLRGPYGGILLSAVGVDANDGMYPVSWAVVESETTESWTWFLQHLCPDLQILIDKEWTFISDRQKVILAFLIAALLYAKGTTVDLTNIFVIYY